MLPIDVIANIISFMEHPPIKARICSKNYGGESIIFMNQIKNDDYRYKIVGGIRPHWIVELELKKKEKCIRNYYKLRY
jgi:hypothetical protein